MTERGRRRAQRAVHPTRRPAGELPSAHEATEDIARLGAERALAVFLDYDGTLTPIVATPDLAVLPESTRGVVRRLSALAPVAVVSGRDLGDVAERVAVPGLTYAGSHGLETQYPDGAREDAPAAVEYRPALARAAGSLERRVRAVPGAWVERKRFALAVHVRQTPDECLHEVRDAVGETQREEPSLRATGGKRVFELRPALEWDKGRLVRHLLARLEDGDAAARRPLSPLYVGDDVTDEDAFAEVAQRGFGVVVGRPDATLACWRVEDVADAVGWLDGLAARIAALSR